MEANGGSHLEVYKKRVDINGHPRSFGQGLIKVANKVSVGKHANDGSQGLFIPLSKNSIFVLLLEVANESHKLWMS